MSINSENIERFVLQMIPEDRPPTEQDLEESVRKFANIFPISEEERTALLRRLHTRLAIQIGRAHV